MAKGKSLGPDGVVLEFYLTFWDMIEQEYIEMIHSSIHSGTLPSGVTIGIIALLHKVGI